MCFLLRAQFIYRYYLQLLCFAVYKYSLPVVCEIVSYTFSRFSRYVFFRPLLLSPRHSSSLFSSIAEPKSFTIEHSENNSRAHSIHPRDSLSVLLFCFFFYGLACRNEPKKNIKSKWLAFDEGTLCKSKTRSYIAWFDISLAGFLRDFEWLFLRFCAASNRKSVISTSDFLFAFDETKKKTITSSRSFFTFFRFVSSALCLFIHVCGRMQT